MTVGCPVLRALITETSRNPVSHESQPLTRNPASCSVPDWGRITSISRGLTSTIGYISHTRYQLQGECGWSCATWTGSGTAKKIENEIWKTLSGPDSTSIAL